MVGVSRSTAKMQQIAFFLQLHLIYYSFRVEFEINEKIFQILNYS